MIIISRKARKLLKSLLDIRKSQESPRIKPEQYEKLIDKFVKIDDNIKEKISEIKYEPNDVDNERFLFSMNDGNYAYITLFFASIVMFSISSDGSQPISKLYPKNS